MSHPKNGNTSRLSTQNLIEEARRFYQAQDFAQAFKLCKRALSQNNQDFEALYFGGLCAYKSGSNKTSLRLLSKAIRLAPENNRLLVDYSTILYADGHVSDALEKLKLALTKEPQNFQAWNTIGSIYKQTELIDEAVKAFQKALDIEPINQHALYNLANTYEKRGDLDKVEDLLCEAEKHTQLDVRLVVLLAKSFRRNKRLEEGINRLLLYVGKPEISLHAQKDMHFELGSLYNANKQPKEALAHYIRANEITKQLVPDADESAKKGLQSAKNMIDFLRTDDLNLTPSSSDDDLASPIFIVGFPRSGTTLLDQILSSHSDVKVLEEEPFISKLIEWVEKHVGSYPKSLSSINKGQRKKLQSYYWKLVKAKIGKNNPKIIIDKLPLNILSLPLIYLVFPKAPVIVALRHPADACMSCFMQDFALNNSMANFLSLTDTAAFYNLTMSVWMETEKRLPIRHHYVRYENIIDNLEAEISELLKFLGLEWQESLKSFYETAQNKATINTPSYHQVTQPIYTSARYRWEQYREYLSDDFMDQLRPFCEKFEYKI